MHIMSLGVLVYTDKLDVMIPITTIYCECLCGMESNIVRWHPPLYVKQLSIHVSGWGCLARKSWQQGAVKDIPASNPCGLVNIITVYLVRNQWSLTTSTRLDKYLGHGVQLLKFSSMSIHKPSCVDCTVLGDIGITVSRSATTVKGSKIVPSQRSNIKFPTHNQKVKKIVGQRSKKALNYRSRRNFSGSRL